MSQIEYPLNLQTCFSDIKARVQDYKRENDDEFQTLARKLYTELELLKIEFQLHLFQQLRNQNPSQINNDNPTEESVHEKYLADLDKQMIENWEKNPTLAQTSESPIKLINEIANPGETDNNSSSGSSKNTETKMGLKNGKYDYNSEFIELQKKLVITKKGLIERISILTILKAISLVLYLVLSFFIFFPLSIVRVFHPLLIYLFNINNNNLPGDHLVRYYTGGFLTVLGTEVSVENSHLLDLDQPTIGMFSHSSNYDAFIVSAHSPIAFKWIGKKSIFFIPFLGWMGWATGMIPINRDNIQSAIMSLAKAAARAKQGRRSITISPEGTRSKSGLLRDFKKGPFHLTKQTGLTMTPILIFGAFELYPPKQILPSPGKVVLRFLAPMQYDKKLSLIENSLKLRQRMLTELGNNFPAAKLKERGVEAEYKSYLFIAFLFLVTAFLIQNFF